MEETGQKRTNHELVVQAYEEYKKDMIRISKRIVADEGLAEDVCHDAFVYILQGHYETIDDIRGACLNMARVLSYNYLRDNHGTDFTDEDVDRVADSLQHSDPEEQMEGQEEIVELVSSLPRSSKEQRTYYRNIKVTK